MAVLQIRLIKPPSASMPGVAETADRGGGDFVVADLDGGGIINQTIPSGDKASDREIPQP
jgi:hypothetical protein